MMANLWDKAKAAMKQLLTPPAETQTEEAQVTASGRVIADHPSEKITPAKLKSMLEDAEMGDITAQHELFVDIEERDGDIAANISTRKRALLTLDWDIVAPDDASPQEEKHTEEVKALFNRIGYLDDFLLDCMDAVGHGFSALEIQWYLLEGKQWPLKFKPIPQAWFRLDKDDNLLLKTPSNPMGEPLRPFGWVVHTHKSRTAQAARMGLYRTLAWCYMFKHYSVHDFAEFLELYGMPIRIGKYGAGATADEKKTLLRALAQIGHNAAGIMPESMQIELHNAASHSGQSNPFLQMVDWCEKTIARIILGQTLTSGVDGKTATNALGNIHNEVRHDLLVSDAKQIAQTVTHQVILPFLQLNIDPNINVSRIPRFEFDTKEREDLTKYADALPKLVGVGMQVPEKWAREKLGIPDAQEGEAVLSVVKTEFNEDLNQDKKPTALSAHVVGCRCAGCLGHGRRAALSVGQDKTEQDLLDELVDDGLKRVDFNQQLDPMVQKAVAVLSACNSYEEAADKLAELYPDLTAQAHQDYLTSALFLADLLGAANAGRN